MIRSNEWMGCVPPEATVKMDCLSDSKMMVISLGSDLQRIKKCPGCEEHTLHGSIELCLVPVYSKLLLNWAQ